MSIGLAGQAPRVAIPRPASPGTDYFAGARNNSRVPGDGPHRG
jgi:hypothetical protein